MLMVFFSSLNSREDRFTHAKKIFTFSQIHRIKLWKVNGVQKLYDILSFELLFCSTGELVNLMKGSYWRDPMMNSVMGILFKRIKELDLTTCLFLGEVCIKVPKIHDLKPLYTKLQQLLLLSVNDSNDAILGGEEVFQVIKLLQKVNHFDLSTAIKVADGLSKKLHQFTLKDVSSIIIAMSRSNHLNHIRDVKLFNAVGSYCSELLHRNESVENRVDDWGESYGYYLSGFFVFYGSTKFYDKNVCDKIKDLFIGPYDKEIHNPKFVSRLAKMCGNILYYDITLLNNMIQLSIRMLSFEGVV